MFTCTTIAPIDPARLPEITEAAKIASERVAKQKGCLWYTFAKPDGMDDRLLILEGWESFEDFEAHGAHRFEPGDPVYDFGQVFDPALTGEPQMFFAPTIV